MNQDGLENINNRKREQAKKELESFRLNLEKAVKEFNEAKEKNPNLPIVNNDILEYLQRKIDILLYKFTEKEQPSFVPLDSEMQDLRVSVAEFIDNLKNVKN